MTDATWREALGELSRVADWEAYLRAQLAEEPWRGVLARWWPRLLPGVARRRDPRDHPHVARCPEPGDSRGRRPAACDEPARVLLDLAASYIELPVTARPSGTLDARPLRRSEELPVLDEPEPGGVITARLKDGLPLASRPRQEGLNAWGSGTSRSGSSWRSTYERASSTPNSGAPPIPATSSSAVCSPPSSRHTSRYSVRCDSATRWRSSTRTIRCRNWTSDQLSTRQKRLNCRPSSTRLCAAVAFRSIGARSATAGSSTCRTLGLHRPSLSTAAAGRLVAASRRAVRTAGLRRSRRHSGGAPGSHERLERVVGRQHRH